MACLKFVDDARLLGLDGGGAGMPFPEPGTEPHYGPSFTFRIVHHHVTLSVDPVARSFTGSARIDIEALPTWTGEAVLDLAEVEVDEVTDGGRALPWTLGDEKLRITAGDARVLVIRWHGTDPRAGLYFTGPDVAHPQRAFTAWTQFQDEDAHFCLPCLDHPRVKHPWTITLEGPAGHTLLSNGVRVAEATAGGRTVATWRQADPIPAYLVTMVSAPLHVTEAEWRGRSVRYLVPPGDEGRVATPFARTPEMIEAFSQFTGVDYPWPRYDQVVVHEFVFGGMENVACTTMTDVLLVDERSGPHWGAEDLVSHELAHQWFGDLVTCQDWSQAWLNESWATFLETVWIDAARGATDAMLHAWEQASAYLSEDADRYRRPIASYLFREPVDMFDRHLYEKGAVVLRTLRAELGDAAFRAGVTLYLTRHAHGTVHGRDFQRAMEDATGRNLDRFFTQWILGAGHPKLAVTLGEEDGTVTVAVKQTQTGTETAQVFHLGLVVEVVGEGGAVRRVTLPVRERERTFVVPVDGKVATVRVDPEFSVLAEVDLSGPTPWLVRLAQDASPVLAIRAVRALGERDTRDANAAVLAALSSHDSWAVRAEAARVVGKRRGDVARDALLVRLTSETEPRVLCVVISTLGTFRDTVVADALLAAIGGPTSTWYVQGDLLDALGRTRDPRALAVCAANLATDSWAEVVRQRAASGVAATEDPAALTPLLDASRGPLDDRAVAGIARALGSLGDRVESVRKACRERLVELVESGGFRTRLGAIDGLARLKDPAALDVLDRVHGTAPDGRLRRMAYEASVAIRKGRTSDEALAGVRARLDAMAGDHAALRARLEKLER